MYMQHTFEDTPSAKRAPMRSYQKQWNQQKQRKSYALLNNLIDACSCQNLFCLFQAHQWFL